jgi:hypothetical protein
MKTKISRIFWKLAPILLIIGLSWSGLYASAIQSAEPKIPINFYGKYSSDVSSVIAQNVPNSVQKIVTTSNAIDYKGIVSNLKSGQIVAFTNMPLDNGVMTPPTFSTSHITTNEYFNMTNNQLSLINKTVDPTVEVTPALWLCMISGGPNGCVCSFSSQVNSPQTYNDMLAFASQKAQEMVINQASEIGVVNAYTTPMPVQMDPGWTTKLDAAADYPFGPGNPPQDEYHAEQVVAKYNAYDTTTNMEFWRVDSYVFSTIGSYQDSAGFLWPISHVGPYVTNTLVKVDATTSTQWWHTQSDPNCLSGLFVYSPQNPIPTDHVSVTVGISGAENGVGFQDSQSWGWDLSQVTTTATAYYNTPYVHTGAAFQIAVWQWGLPGVVSPPTQCSYESFSQQYSSIYRTPVGATFPIDNLYTSWNLEDDYCYNVWGMWIYAFNTYPTSWSTGSLYLS